MPAATNQQVQTFVNERMRPYCEAIRAVKLETDDNEGAIGDIYANLNNNPDWTDNRTDGPPSLLAPSDVLAWNTFMFHFKRLIDGCASDAERIASANEVKNGWATILKACVRPV